MGLSMYNKIQYGGCEPQSFAKTAERLLDATLIWGCESDGVRMSLRTSWSRSRCCGCEPLLNELDLLSKFN